jgi:hypothetical protein
MAKPGAGQRATLLTGHGKAAYGGAIPTLAVVGIVRVQNVELLAQDVGVVSQSDGRDVEAGLVGIVAEVFEHGGHGPRDSIRRFGVGDQIAVVNTGR